MEIPVWLAPDRRRLPSLKGGKRKCPERRNSPRFIIRLPIKIKVGNLGKNISSGIEGETLNLSESGVDIILKSRLDDFTTFSLIVESPFDALKTDMPVELVWTAPKIKERKFLYGFRFLKLEEEQLLCLRKLLYLSGNLITEQVNRIIRLVSKPTIIEKVRGFFIEDLKDYLEGLINLEREMYREGPNALGQKELNKLNNEILKKADELEGIVGSSIILREIKRRFRLIVSGFAYQSLIVKRASDKPLGYPGDYELLENIYDNQALSERIGFYFDKSFLDNSYAVAVRNRKDKMKVVLKEFINNSSLPLIRILNLACGSCREIKELFFGEVASQNRVVFECVDQDEKALEFAKQSLGKLPENIEIKFSKENILEIIDKPSYYSNLIGKQHLIYCIGLADYLPDRILKKLVHFCFELLYSGGRLIITHKDVDKYKPLHADWFCDWTFIPRNKEKLTNLVKDSRIDNFSTTIGRDDSQIILFLTLRKH